MDDPGEAFILDIDAATLEALVETLYLAAYADGEFSEQERTQFAHSVNTLTQGRLSGEGFESLLGRVVEQHRSAGRDARIDAIKERLTTDELRQIALVLATDMVAIDGVLHDAERDLILSLASAFGIAEDAAQELLADSMEG